MENVLQNIYIGSKSMDSIELKYENIEVPLYNGEDQEFQIFIKNFGTPTTLSFEVEKSIEDYVILTEPKPYVRNNHYTRVILRVPYNAKPVAEGKFYIISGYGSKRASFNLRIGMSGGEDQNYYKPPMYDEKIYETEEPTYIPPGAFKIKKDWRNARKESAKKGIKLDKNIIPGVFTNKNKNPRQYPANTKQIRTKMDMGGIIISSLFVLSLILAYIYILKTDVAETLAKSQVIILSAIIIGFAIFVMFFVLNFFKTTVESE